jgi:hypothetical protein
MVAKGKLIANLERRHSKRCSAGLQEAWSRPLFVSKLRDEWHQQHQVTRSSSSSQAGALAKRRSVTAGSIWAQRPHVPVGSIHRDPDCRDGGLGAEGSNLGRVTLLAAKVWHLTGAKARGRGAWSGSAKTSARPRVSPPGLWRVRIQIVPRKCSGD